jgi:hypothetical protein
MDWKSVGNVVAQSLPLVGSLLAGRAGEAVGSMVASVLGVEATPEAVSDIIEKDPHAIDELRAMEQQNQRELIKMHLEAETARLSEVNQTMRVEATSEHWPQYSWRPYWGFISGTAFIVLVCFVCFLAYDAIESKNPESLRMIPDLIGEMALLFSIPGAILGVTAWHRGKMKREQISGVSENSGLLAKIFNR